MLLAIARIAVASLCLAVIDHPAQAQDRTIVTLGTATPGGGFPVYGDAVARIINETDPTLLVQTRNTKGSAENIPLLEAGALDMALVQGEAAFEAMNGIGRPPANLKILAAMYTTPGMFVVRADSAHRSIRDLVGHKVAFGARGSGLVILARYVLDGMGLDMDRDFQAIYLDRAGDGPAMVLDGRAAALWGGGRAWPGFTVMANSQPGARFITPSAEDIASIRAKHRFLSSLVVPADSYPKQDRDLNSVGSWSYIMMRPMLADDVAYRVARALHRGEDDLARRLPQAQETTAANTGAIVPRSELHPGVARYLDEVRLLR